MPVPDLMHKAGRKMGGGIPEKDLSFGRFSGLQSLPHCSAAQSSPMIGIKNAYLARYLFLTYGALNAHFFQIYSCPCEWGCGA